MALGRTVFPNGNIFPTRVSADGNPRYKVGGITIDWGNITAPGSDVTLPDGSIIKAGQKYVRYGQVMTKETLSGGTGTVQTLTGTATGGTFTFTFTRSDNQTLVTTAALAFNATAAQVLAAIQAVAAPGQAVSSSGGALGTAAVPVVFSTSTPIGSVNAALLTGGTVTVALTNAGSTGGYFGPFDSAATDGRQNLNRGDCFVMDQTVLQYSSGSNLLSVSNDQVGGAIDGGTIKIDRVLQSGVGAHSLAAGPTLAEFLAAFPMFQIDRD